MKNVSAIISADWHIRETAPVCRDESEYFEAQSNKLKFILDLQHEHRCPILIAGDIYNHWKPSPFLSGWFVRFFTRLTNETIYTVPGQHDLPQHSKLLYEKSGLHLLDVTDELEVLKEGQRRSMVGEDYFELHGFWYSESEPSPSVLDEIDDEDDTPQVALCHTFTWRGRKPWPDCVAPGAGTLLKKMRGFDLVVTGDNHKAFTLEQDGRLLVNPGSLMRMSADQADFKPRVYLWDAEANEVEPVFLPIEPGVVSRDHLDRVQERDERIESFVARLQGQWKAGLSFDENMKRFLETNEVPLVIKLLIEEAMENG